MKTRRVLFVSTGIGPGLGSFSEVVEEHTKKLNEAVSDLEVDQVYNDVVQATSMLSTVYYFEYVK